MKQQVLITQRIPEAGISRLKEFFHVSINDSYQPAAAGKLSVIAPDAAGILSLLSDRIDESFLDAFPKLKVIANYAVGVNNIDLQAAKKRGIVVTNTPGVLTNATADLALGLLLAVARHIVPADQYCRDGKFTGWKSDLFTGFDFSGKVAGIIGMGQIGTSFAKRLIPLGCRILYHNRTRMPEDHLPVPGAEWRSLDDLIAESDIVSLHVPLTSETRGILSEHRLKRMKKGSILINTGRGELVDEAVLAGLLENGHLFGAGLDVFEREPIIHPMLKSLPSVVLTPHIGSATVETRNRMALMAADSIIDGLSGRNPTHRVV